MNRETVIWPQILDTLVRGDDLDESTARAVMTALISGDVDPARIAGFLTAVRAKGESSAEIAGFVRAMLDAAVPIDLGSELAGRLVDTCGTGGDSSGTFNISTVAAVVTAAAGVPVAKHGNRAASSVCGSADLLERWGVAIELPAEAVAECLEEVGIGFLFARTFHPAMRFVAPVRQQLGIRTVFNVLGPLSNPAGAPNQVVGVSDVSLAPVMAEALARLGKRRALVFRGRDGLDELTTTAPNDVWEVVDGEVVTSVLDPLDLDIPRASPGELRGGGVEENVEIADAVLAGEPGAPRQVVALNAAAALVVADAAADLAEGLRMAHDAIDDGRARELLARWVQRSRQLV